MPSNSQEQLLFNGPEYGVLETEYWQVGQDWEVPIPGFFILALKRKGVHSIIDFTAEEWKEYSQLLRRVRQGMKLALGIEEVYFFQNEDSPNFHAWLLPRLDWIESLGQKIESIRPIMEYARKNMATEEIKRQMQDYVAKLRDWLKSNPAE